MLNPNTASILGIVAALVCAILSVILITPASKRDSLNPFFRVLADIFNFRGLIIEKLLKFFYIVSTYFCIFGGFFMIFSGYDSYYGSRSFAGQGLLTMILGPIMIRIIFEFAMLTILLIKNVIEINNKLKNQNGNKAKADAFSQPIYTAPAAKEASVAEEAPAAVEAPAEEAAEAPADFVTK